MRSADSFVDVLVQVLNVIPPYDSQAGKLVIWDGTGQLNAIDSYVQALSSTPQSFGICMEIRIESCWLVLEKMGFIQHIKDGWVRFRNLAVEQLPDDFNQECRFVLHFREVSSLVLMPTFVCEVQERLTWIDRRCISASARTAAERSIQNTSSTSFQDENVQIRTVIGEYAIKIPITSLEAIQNSKRVPNKYHCIAFVTSCWPSDIEKLTKLQQVGDKYEYVYSFVLRLQDFSGTIDVIVHGKDAEKFLRPIAPSDFSKSTPSKKILERKISALIQSRKLVHFCIKSYQVKQKQHPPEQSASQSAKEEQNIMEIRYRLFDTILL
jgi:hypothetical protein